MKDLAAHISRMNSWDTGPWLTSLSVTIREVNWGGISEDISTVLVTWQERFEPDEGPSVSPT